MEGYKFGAYTEIWRKYAEAKPLDNIVRAGFVACGTGKIQPKWRWVRQLRRMVLRWLHGLLGVLGETRAETDGGHTFGLMLLIDLCHRFMPEKMPDWLWRLLMAAAPYHELAEITQGDLLDDGTQDARAKVLAEAKIFEEYFIDVPNAAEILYVLKRSEEMKGIVYADVEHGNWLEEAAWWLKALDKVEAVLQNGVYKRAGVVGHLRQKEHISESDRQAMHELGTDEISIAWTRRSGKFLEDSPVWYLMVAMIYDLYPFEEIPPYFATFGY